VIAKREVRPDEPSVLLKCRGERRLRGLCLEAADQEARGDPAAFERAGGAQQVVPAVGYQLVADLAAPRDVDREVGAGRAEAVEALVGKVPQRGRNRRPNRSNRAKTMSV